MINTCFHTIQQSLIMQHFVNSLHFNFQHNKNKSLLDELCNQEMPKDASAETKSNDKDISLNNLGDYTGNGRNTGHIMVKIC